MRFASFYVGSGLSPYLQACLKSWAYYGHSLDLYVYDDATVVPPGVRRCDANAVISSREMYTYRQGAGAGSVSAFSNEFRYRLLQHDDVVWVDTDVLCLCAEWPERDYYLAWENSRRELCNVAVFGAPRTSVLATALYDHTTAMDHATLSFGDSGPKLVTRLLTELGLTDLPTSYRDFYPVHFTECHWLMDPDRRRDVEERVAGSFALHLWDEIWTRARVPTFLRPPRGSYLESVLARHDIVMPVEATYEDFDSLAFVEPPPVVQYHDYVALAEWAKGLEHDLIALRASLRAPEAPSGIAPRPRRWIRRP